MRSLGRAGIFVVALLLISYEPKIIQAEEPTTAWIRKHYLKNYSFSKDMFTRMVLPVWEETLGHLKGKPNINYLEIGVFEGGSAIWMLENILTAPTAKMTCIDIFPGQLREKFLANLRISGFYEKVTVIKGYSQVELRYLPLNSFDIIYIDGSRRAKNILADAILSWELLKTGGIMIFRDFNWEKDTVPAEISPQVAIDSFISAFKNDVEIIHHNGQVILKKLYNSVGSGTFVNAH
jgi:predicted O-methyltransferase YrrM